MLCTFCRSAEVDLPHLTEGKVGSDTIGYWKVLGSTAHGSINASDWTWCTYTQLFKFQAKQSWSRVIQMILVSCRSNVASYTFCQDEKIGTLKRIRCIHFLVPSPVTPRSFVILHYIPYLPSYLPPTSHLHVGRLIHLIVTAFHCSR